MLTIKTFGIVLYMARHVVLRLLLASARCMDKPRGIAGGVLATMAKPRGIAGGVLATMAKPKGIAGGVLATMGKPKGIAGPS